MFQGQALDPGEPVKSRPTPQPINYKRGLPEWLKRDRQVVRWTHRLLGNPEARPADLSEEQLSFVMLEVLRRRPEQLDRVVSDLYLKAMAETTPVLAAPALERENLVEDLELIWSQPEMRRFWSRWQGRRAEKGPRADFTTAKGLMAMMGTAGISPHADDAYAALAGNSRLWSLFQALEEGETRPPLSYQNALKQLPRLACWREAMHTNIELVKVLAEQNPGKGIGERLMVDGMGLAAWCKQIGRGKTDEEENYRRRHCPEAGARMTVQGPRHKHSIRENETGSAQKMLLKGKFWRGYYRVVIADQASGLPLVWTVVDAAQDEAAAIIGVLSDLYRFWPECPAQLIAGDSAWDEDRWCQLCGRLRHPSDLSSA